MKCSRIKVQLSAFLDGELDEQARQEVGNHLEGCPDCRAELAALKYLLDQVHELPSPRAPADFAARLHDRMQQPSWGKRFLRHLFKPYHVKIPLELAAAAVVSILLFFVIQPAPEKTLDHILTGKSMETAAPAEDASDVTAPDLKKEAPAGETFNLARKSREQGAAPQAAAPAPAPAGPIAVSWFMQKTPGKGGRLAADRQYSAERRMESDAAAEAELKSQAEPIASSLAILEESLRRANGRITETAADASGNITSVRAALPADQYPHFIDSLAAYGRIQAPDRGAVSAHGDTLQLSISIHID